MKWWAQYVESTRNMELAMKYYEEAKDYLSTVRILCFLQNTKRAAEVADRSSDSAACYHLARHYESIGQIENAVNFFIKSNAYANAIRICKVSNEKERKFSLFEGYLGLVDLKQFTNCRKTPWMTNYGKFHYKLELARS